MHDIYIGKKRYIYICLFFFVQNVVNWIYLYTYIFVFSNKVILISKFLHDTCIYILATTVELS